jgi:hypothetical protein
MAETGRSLEEEVARLFRAAGCTATVRTNVQGARGSENVDVLVEMDTLGFRETWAVECKNKKDPAKRSDVQTFQNKVANIGATFGVMVSRSGYQSGCDAVAKNRNLLLTTPEELDSTLDEAITKNRLQALLAKLTELLNELHRMTRVGRRVEGQQLRQGRVSRLPTGPGADQYVGNLGKIAIARDRVTEVIAGGKSLRVPIYSSDDGHSKNAPYRTARSRTEFCGLVEKLVSNVETWKTGLVVPLQTGEPPLAP